MEWLIHSPELEKNQRVFKRGKPKSAAPKCAEMSPLTNTKLSNRIKKETTQCLNSKNFSVTQILREISLDNFESLNLLFHGKSDEWKIF